MLLKVGLVTLASFILKLNEKKNLVEKEHQVRSDDYGRDLSSVQLLLTKQDAFDAGLNAFEHEGIQRITELKDQLVAAQHQQTPNIEKRHVNVMARWQQLLV